MDDVVNSVPSWMFTAIIAVCILFIIGIIFARLYRRASAEQAFVRTGLGGQKVVMSGGAIVMPIFHEIIPINMNTLKLEVSRSTIDSLITKDRMRVDVVVAFFVRVKPSVEGIATAAQTLGQRTLSPEDLRMLVEDKFVDALRATAAQMTMHELQDTRENFVQGVQNTVAEDLSKNGLELESVSLTNFNQTSKEHFNPNNAFDAEGLTKLTQETERRRRERNEVEQDVEVAVREKNRDALSRKLEIEQQEAFMTLEQDRLKPVPLSRMRKLRLLKLNVVVKQSRREFWLNDRFRKQKSTANRPSAQEKLKLNVKFALKRSNSSRSPKSLTRRNRSLLPPNRNNSPRQKRVLTLHSQKQ